MADLFAFKNSAGAAPSAADLEFEFHSETTFSANGEGEAKQRRFSGIGYTGDIITGHPYWGQVVFDLRKMKVPQKMPILRDHYTEKIVGHSDKYAITDKGLELEGHLTQSTPFGQEVIALSDEGFPWQMSVRIHPSTIEEIKPGSTASVNGRTVTGPAYIFRDSKIVETSFTPTGWDSNTSATALSRVNSNEEDTQMSKELEDKVKELEVKLADMTASRDTLQAEITKRDAQIQADKETKVKDAFSKAGKELSAESITAFTKLPQEAQDVMLASLVVPAKEPEKKPEKKPETKLPEGMFSDQATGGKEEPKPLEGKGLLAACDAAANDFKASRK